MIVGLASEGSIPRKLPGLMCKYMQIGILQQTLTATPVVTIYRLPILTQPFAGIQLVFCRNQKKNTQNSCRTCGCLNSLTGLQAISFKSFLLLLSVNSPISIQMKFYSFRYLLSRNIASEIQQIKALLESLRRKQNSQVVFFISCLVFGF